MPQMQEASRQVFTTRKLSRRKVGRKLRNDSSAVAERASSRFHELHNEQNFKAIYELFDKGSQPNQAVVLSQVSANYGKFGRSLESQLVEKKVLPSPAHGYTSQVKLAYETKFEKGNWTELFAWNIRNSTDAVLVDYVIVERKTSTSSGTPSNTK